MNHFFQLKFHSMKFQLRAKNTQHKGTERQAALNYLYSMSEKVIRID